MIFAILGIFLSLFGAIAYRLRGGGWKETRPKFLDSSFSRRFLCALTIGVGAVCTGAYLPFVDAGTLNYLLSALAVAVVSFFGVIIGHGSYFPREGTNEDNEKFRFITKLISDPLNAKARFIGMAITGLAITIPVAFIPGVSVLYAAFGIMKAVSYMIAYSLRERFPHWTEVAELKWGFWMIAGFFLSSLTGIPDLASLF